MLGFAYVFENGAEFYYFRVFCVFSLLFKSILKKIRQRLTCKGLETGGRRTAADYTPLNAFGLQRFWTA